MLVNKLFPDLIILPLILPPLLDNRLKPDHYLNSLDFLEPLLFICVPHLQLQKHNDDNGEGNSSKKNSLKTHSKELVKTQSLSRQLILEYESMIQQSSKGVMLRFFSFSYLPDTRLIRLCIPSPSLFHITYMLPTPSPYYMFHYLRSLLLLVLLMCCLLSVTPFPFHTAITLSI